MKEILPPKAYNITSLCVYVKEVDFIFWPMAATWNQKIYFLSNGFLQKWFLKAFWKLLKHLWNSYTFLPSYQMAGYFGGCKF